jgi:hypothetical protein
MKHIAIASVVLLAGLGLAGCSAGNSSSFDTGTSGGSALEPASPGGIAAGDAAAPESRDEAALSDRSVITTGYITVTAETPLEAASEAIRIVEGVNGRVDGRREYAPVDGNKGAATLTLRIPATDLTATIDKLKGLGEVEEISITSTDVTSQVQDVDGRIKALQASVDRLTVLLATATTTADLVQIESSLSQRQADLESMQSQQRALGDAVDLATITLSLISVADAPVDTPDTFLSGLAAGWAAFLAFVSGTLVVVGVMLPWIAFLALAAAIVLIALRVRRSRKVAAAAGS